MTPRQKKEETQEKEEETQENVEEYNPIVDQKPLPQALMKVIDNGNQRVLTLQQEVMQEIQDSAYELMLLMGLDPNDGWRLDLQTRQFLQIKVEDPS
ncbi:MAG: hypothetical protein VW683_01575 [Betaproteobacteria bacterium]|jgi:hypothetical protein